MTTYNDLTRTVPELAWAESEAIAKLERKLEEYEAADQAAYLEGPSYSSTVPCQCGQVHPS